MTTREAASDRRSRRGYLRPSAPNCEATREAAAAVPSLCLPPRGAGRRLQHAGPGLPPETCNPQQSNQRHEAAGAPAPNIHLHEDATVEAPPHAWPCGAQGYNSFLGGTCSTKCSNCFFIKKCTKADWQAVSLLDDLFHAIVGRPRLRSQERKLPAEL
ncbi:unnamed protein product [Urochloa humidicola]